MCSMNIVFVAGKYVHSWRDVFVKLGDDIESAYMLIRFGFEILGVNEVFAFSMTFLIKDVEEGTGDENQN